MAGNAVAYEVEFSSLERQLVLLRAEPRIADEHLSRAMTQSVLAVEAAVKPLVPVFRGRLRGSIGGQVKHEGPGSIVGRVGSSLNEVYPAVMEFGRRPGAAGPPSNALERWAHLVLGDVRLAFVVARAIHRRGIRGRFFMRKGAQAAEGKVLGFFTEALTRIAQALAGK
jgi:hypothetical protein